MNPEQWIGSHRIEVVIELEVFLVLDVSKGVGCCGFAGDKGFSHPEMNKHALRHLKPAIEKNHVTYGYSNSRTCEIGLQTHSGVPYMSIAYLVNEATTPK